MADPTVKAIDALPKLVRESIVKQIIAGVPLKSIADKLGISDRTVRRYQDEVVIPRLEGDLMQTSATTQSTETKAVIDNKTQQVVASCQNAKVRGEVQQAVIALRNRAECVLTRVESRADENFNGREWAAVATLAARMLETQGRITGELTDRVTGSDINIQIVMPANTSTSQDQVTIDVDAVRSIDSD